MASCSFNDTTFWHADLLITIVNSLLPGRRSGLMVSVLDSGSNGPGSSPGRGTVLCSWARHFTPIVPLSTQEYKWVTANLLLGVTLRWTTCSIPSRGSGNTPSHFMLQKTG